MTHIETSMPRNNTKTYRFKVSSSDLYDEIINFSKLHQFDDKNTLKDNFKNWYETPKIANLIENEENILIRSNYNFEKTNMKQKIFRSIKYYHIRNLLKTEPINNNQKKRIKQMNFSKEFINQVKSYLTKNVENDNFKPSVYFNYFCETFPNIIENEKTSLMNQLKENYEESDFDYKLKKMFKNQYFSMFKS